MFSISIIDTDKFIDMPATARLLYYDLAMRADDDGFIGSPNKIVRMIGSSPDDMKLLIAKQYIIPFPSGVCVIRDWRVHNYIQKDRYTPTRYQEEMAQLIQDETGVYTLCTQGRTQGCIQPVSNLDTQVRDRLELGKVRDNITRAHARDAQEQGESLTVEMARGSGEEPVDHSTTPVMTRFARFWEAYPRKVGKGSAEKAWKKLNPTESLTDRIISAVKAQKKSRQWLRDGGQYIPNPATWLTQRRWEDDLQEVVEANTPKALQTSYDLDEWERETVTVPGFGDSGP